MYLFGHTGLTAGAARAADRGFDLRWAVALSLGPDLIDKPISFLVPALFNENSRGYGHTGLAAVAVFLAAAAVLRSARKAVVPWACYAGHLLLDRMWLHDNPKIFFWPFLGPFPPALHGGVNGDLLRGNLVGEAAGLAVLVWLVRRHGLTDPARRDAFLRTGSLR